MSPNDQGDVVDGQEVTSRRNVLIGGASLAAFAWAAPGIMKLDVAYAAGTSCDEDTFLPTENPQTFTASGSYRVPFEATSITVESWGSGGNGGVGSADAAGGGGGGGGYVSQSFSITAQTCAVYTVTVGAGAGESSSFVGPEISVVAPGGGNANGDIAGTGGLGTANGGDGADAVTTGGNRDGGGGGGAAGGPDGVGGPGGAPDGNIGGAGGTPAGVEAGAGGSGGSTDAVGGPGVAPGGGGGGASRTAGASGGAGARGQVRITWS